MISLIIPSLNQGKYISATIDSILSQNNLPIEIIVMDGGSTDNTLEILKSYKTMIKWTSEKDDGQSDAINKGLMMASGDILGYINSDDYLLPGSLESIMRAFEDRGTLWVSGDALIVDEKDRVIQRGVSFYKKILRSFSADKFIYLTNVFIQPSTFWRRSVFDKIGLFDPNLHYTMDYDYWFRILKIGKPKILNQALSAFRIHSESKGGVKFRQQIQEEMMMLKRYTNSKSVFTFHHLHSKFIEWSYGLLKDRKFKNTPSNL